MAGGVRAAEPSAALNPGCLEQGKGRKWERNRLLPLALQSCEGRSARRLSKSSSALPSSALPGVSGSARPSAPGTDLLGLLSCLDTSQHLQKHRSKLGETIPNPSRGREGTYGGWLLTRQRRREGQRGTHLPSGFWWIQLGPDWCKCRFSARADPVRGAVPTPGQVRTTANRQLGSTGRQRADGRESPRVVKTSPSLLGRRGPRSVPQGWRGAAESRGGKEQNPPFAQGSPVFLWQSGN